MTAMKRMGSIRYMTIGANARSGQVRDKTRDKGPGLFEDVLDRTGIGLALGHWSRNEGRHVHLSTPIPYRVAERPQPRRC